MSLIYITVTRSLYLRNSVTYLCTNIILIIPFLGDNIVTIRTNVKTELSPFVFCVCIRYIPDDG